MSLVSLWACPKALRNAVKHRALLCQSHYLKYRTVLFVWKGAQYFSVKVVGSMFDSDPSVWHRSNEEPDGSGVLSLFPNTHTAVMYSCNTCHWLELRVEILSNLSYS